MPQPTVFKYSESSEVANALASCVIRCQNTAIAKHHNFNVAISGGSLVNALRDGLLGRPEIKWDKWKIYFTDERIVPLDHEDSSYGRVKKEILDHLDVQPKVYTIDADLVASGAPADAIANKYAETLERTLHTTPVFVNPITRESRLVPRFDLVVLGCGPDGHTCSLFPGHPLLQETTLNVAAVEDSPKPPARRISLTKLVLEGAAQIAFVAQGPEKTAVLNRIFNNRDKSLPAFQINMLARNSVFWFVDDKAAEGVNIAFNK